MGTPKIRLSGVELYFDDIDGAKKFYKETLGLSISDEEEGHYYQFDAGSAFVCLEKKGTEPYPSMDKAVLFLEVADVASAVESIGRERFVGFGNETKEGNIPWAVFHDPEGHNIMLLQSSGA